jgi:hypothetical protein
MNNCHYTFKIEICGHQGGNQNQPQIGQLFSYDLYPGHPHDNIGITCNGNLCTNTDIGQAFKGTHMSGGAGNTYMAGSYFKLLSFSNLAYRPDIINFSTEYCPTVDPLDADRDRDREIDNSCDKFWSLGAYAQDCCIACDNLNLNPLSHPNHSCTKWCKCCDQRTRLQQLANIR